MADPVTTPPRPAGKGASDSERARAQAEAWQLPFAPLDAPPDEPGLWSEVPLELLAVSYTHLTLPTTPYV